MPTRASSAAITPSSSAACSENWWISNSICDNLRRLCSTAARLRSAKDTGEFMDVPLLIATRATSARNGRRGNVELRVLQGRDHLLRRASSTFFALLFRRLGDQVGL